MGSDGRRSKQHVGVQLLQFQANSRMYTAPPIQRHTHTIHHTARQPGLSFVISVGFCWHLALGVCGTHILTTRCRELARVAVALCRR